MSILILITILFFVLAFGGGLGHSRFGYVGWSPLGLFLVIVVVLWATGFLHVPLR